MQIKRWPESIPFFRRPATGAARRPGVAITRSCYVPSRRSDPVTRINWQGSSINNSSAAASEDFSGVSCERPFFKCEINRCTTPLLGRRVAATPPPPAQHG
ncbi:hypothetical protein EVAR_17120_1 [Eumeta japonica]|uniref:Uncharacterized protein n=1 Tax=Eumeta variegata TaxID=151549 RepID=A0A4C1ULV3_EUMVA|nr:hypothetical protein EVAR_17120_1 [Eumeta japonica]